MSQVYDKLQQCYESVRKKVNFVPKAAIVLGSGLGAYADGIQVEEVLDYQEIEGFPVSTVPGHKGRFVFGYIDTIPVIIMQGRVHFYEGYPMQEVVLPVRLMGRLGAEILFLTNAAGGVNYDFHAGDFMLIRDQIASFIPSPLIGPNDGELGTRFPDMSHIYDTELAAAIERAAKRQNITLQQGVYLQFTGPAFETPAEIRMARALGADAVGMSTACEALAANHMGMRVCGISCISNLGCGMTDQPLTHQEVQETADRVAPLFRSLITASVLEMCTMK